MPRPVQPGGRYIPGLDGVRALAVLSVIAYHLNVHWAQGGLLGVGVFFTLSGYLITDLLLGHWHRHGDLGLGVFWLRRARRLLPALFLMLAAVSIWVALFDASQLAALRRQVIAAALYFGNWSTIAQHGSYFARFALPLPLDHLWSLAIEEQFYLVWPWLLLLGIWTVRSRKGLALITLVGAAISAYAMGRLYHPGYDPTRVYEGTDTRAFGLLIGAALAMVWPTRSARPVASPATRDVLDALGVAGLIGILVLVWRTNSTSAFLYPYGFVLLSLATAAMVAALVNPTSRLGPVLGWRPLRWVGVRSYGIYLWQWPIIVLAGSAQSPVNWGRAALEVAGTLLIASLSWHYVEEPIRHGALGRLWRQVPSGSRRLGARRRTLVLTSATLAILSLVVLSLAGVLPRASSGLASTVASAGPPPKLSALTTTARARSAGARPAKPAVPISTRTSCRSVVYIGDSTSEGEISTDYIPNSRQRLPAQLADVGVSVTVPEISGARSIVETFEGQPNAATVAQDHISQGFRGCWILALGTNDVDNVHTGSTISLATRIARMMSIIGHQPVLWIDAITLLGTGPYSEQNMQVWNSALLAACSHFPTMRVYDWAAHAKRAWFIPDGIHYYSPGYVARTHLIARALASAFPNRPTPSASCLVQ
jgi:peptidoglycan/LPS O-acetylase OafA/YrhL